MWKDKYICEILKPSQIGITFLLRIVLKTWWHTSLLCSLPGKEPRLALLWIFSLLLLFSTCHVLPSRCFTNTRLHGLQQQWKMAESWPWRVTHRQAYVSKTCDPALRRRASVSQRLSKLKAPGTKPSDSSLSVGLCPFISSVKTQNRRLAWRLWKTFFCHTIFFLKN